MTRTRQEPAKATKRITSRDVARRAKVSQTTVSRVLTGRPGVRPETQAAVLQALDELGYAPNATARAMRTRYTGTVGVVIARITNPFYPELVEVLGGQLALSGRRMILWDSEVGDSPAIDAIRQHVVDGVIFTTATADSQPLKEALSRDLPVVLVNRSITGVHCDTVTSHNRRGGARMARYFVSSGRTRCAMIGGLPGTSTGDERHAGFARGLVAADVGERSWSYLTGDFTYEHGFESFLQLMKSSPSPDAVFCANDLLAFGAMSAARYLGVRVPDDVWIAGYDDVPMAAWPAFDLTTVRQPIDQMAATAVRFVIDRIEGNQEAPRHPRFPSDLILRASTGGGPLTDAVETD